MIYSLIVAIALTVADGSTHTSDDVVEEFAVETVRTDGTLMSVYVDQAIVEGGIWDIKSNDLPLSARQILRVTDKRAEDLSDDERHFSSLEKISLHRIGHEEQESWIWIAIYWYPDTATGEGNRLVVGCTINGTIVDAKPTKGISDGGIGPSIIPLTIENKHP